MLHQQAQRMYAVALSLVPDSQVAADLVFRSKNDAELRQRALAWRRQQGLPALAPGDEPPPVALSLDDEDLAEHLYRRGARQRRVRSVGVAMLACLLVFGTVVAGLRYKAMAPPTGLVYDHAFAEEPLNWTPAAGQQLQLLVYKAEAYPGAVTIWWELLGPGADKVAQEVADGLRIHVPHDIAATESEIAVHRPNRVLGRSLFPYLNAPQRIDLLLGELGGKPVNWALELALNRLPADPNAMTYNPDKQLNVMGGILEIQTLRVGKYATTVVLRHVQPPYTFSLAEITAGEQRLTRQGTWLPATRPDGEYEMVLQPVPQGSKQLRIAFPLNQTEVKQYRWQLPAPEAFKEFRTEGDRLLVTLVPDFAVPLNAWGGVVDDKGQYFNGNVRKGTDGSQSVLRAEIPLAYRMTIPVFEQASGGRVISVDRVDIQAGVLTELFINVEEPVPDPEVVIDLQQAP